MTAVIPIASRPIPFSNPGRGQQPFVDRSGRLTSFGMQALDSLARYVGGGNRVIPCSAAGANDITLTPNDWSPLLTGYVDYEVFVFTAAANSTGDVTITVVPKIGTLAVLNAYVAAGATRATAGDLVADCVYLAIYADHLNGAAGGFVIK